MQGPGPDMSVVRGCVVAALCAVLTAAGHVAAGGTLGDLTLLIVLLPLLAVLFTSAATACRGALGTVAVLGVGQLVLHHAMVLMHPPHHVEQAALGAGGMVAMHAVVTLVTAVALRHADAALAALATALHRVLPRPIPQSPAHRPPVGAVVPAHDAGRLHPSVLLAAAPRRGPPQAC